jgi:hypothetical protein
MPNEGRTGYRPGETIRGIVRWELDREVDALELRLVWETDGKGTKDSETVQRVRFDRPLHSGSREFVIKLPDAPYSFSGKLITLSWALWLVAGKSKQSVKFPIVISPTAQEIDLLQSDGGNG